MAEAAEQLVVALEARIRDFEKNMARAQRTANDNFRGIRRSAQVSGRAMEQAMSQSASRMEQNLGRFGTTAAGSDRRQLHGHVAPARPPADSEQRLHAPAANRIHTVVPCCGTLPVQFPAAVS